MRISEIIKLLRAAIQNKFPVLIKGIPGGGKTDGAHQATELENADMKVFHPVVQDPTDFKGLPCVQNGQADFMPFGDLRALMTAKKPTVAFLDDLGQAPAVVQAAAMQLILARQINGHRISDHIVFFAATNRKEDRAGVTGILEPVKSRFATIVELTVNLDDWCNWALGNEIPPEIVAFVRFRPQLFLSPSAPTGDIVNRPSPRTVANMAKLYKAGFKNDPEVLGGAVGEGFASEFIAFVKVVMNLPSIESIIANPESAAIPKDAASLYAVSTALAARVEPKNAEAVIKYLHRLPEEFGVLGMRDAVRMQPAIKQTKGFVKWACDNAKLLG